MRFPEREVMPQLNGGRRNACYPSDAAGKAVPSTTGEEHMRTATLLGMAALIAAVAAPALADDAMSSGGGMSSMGGQMMMVKKGETIAIMPDGHMGTTMTSDKMGSDEMMKMAKPLDHCMMFMMGHDGKMYAIDAMGHAGIMTCEKIAK
jgi:hypothetical protein